MNTLIEGITKQSESSCRGAEGAGKEAWLAVEVRVVVPVMVLVRCHHVVDFR